MKNLFLVALLSAAIILGQSGGPYLGAGVPIIVTAQSVFNSRGGFLQAGRLCFVPSTGSAAVCGVISNGALTSTLQVPSLGATQTYTIQVLDSSLNQSILWIPGVTALSRTNSTTFSWDSFVIPGTYSATGLGMPGNYYCASGASYLQSDAPASAAPWRCVNGVWYRGNQQAPARTNPSTISGGGSTSTPLGLKVNSINTGSQTTLNLKQGANMTITDDGVGGVTFTSTGGSGATLKTNGANNGNQGILNLKQGGNMTVSDDGNGGVTFAAVIPPGATLKTNGTTNGSQSVLNLKQGTNTTLADDGVGGITISSAPAQTVALKTNGTTNGSQTQLNLKQGANMNIADDGAGSVTLASTATTVSIGSVSTGAPGTPASVTATGTATNVVLNFVFPGTSSSTPSLTFSPSTLTFSSTTNGTSNGPQTVVVTNTATSFYTVSSISLTGTNAADFTQTNNCGSQIASGASCSVNVTFTPTYPGSGLSWSESASLSIQGAATFTSSISGAGQVLNGGLVVTASNYGLLSGGTSAIVANRPVTLSAPLTGSFTQTDSTHYTYTAPAHIPQSAAVNGCQAGPVDSILNTPITSLPVHASNTAWLSQIGNYGVGNDGAFLYNVLTGTPTVVFETLKFYYGNAQYSTGPYPLHSYPWWRENGQWASSFNGGDARDHHEQFLTTTNCTFYETYNRAQNIAYTAACQDGTNGCNAGSGNVFTPSLYTIPLAATDRAGLPLYLATTAYEIKTNTIHHPVRFTLAGGFIAATNPQWPATAGEFGSISNTPPMGARLRLKASFNTSTYSQYAQNILNSYKNYGMILTDGGTSGNTQYAADVLQDPALFAAISEAHTGLKLSNFEIVDQSSMMLSATSYQVKPNNPYQAPTASAYMIATDTVNQSDGNKYSVALPISLQGIGVGLKYPLLAMVPGSYSYQIPAFVTGSSNQTITWVLTSGVGSVATNGIYTPPASVASVQQVVLTATAAADSSATAQEFITLIPVSSDGHIRIVGNPTSVTDGNGVVWNPTIGVNSGSWIYYGGDTTWTNLTTNPEATIYQRSTHTYGSDINYHIIMPNGNYRVRWLNGQTRALYQVTSTFPQSLHNPMYIGTGDQITAHAYQWGAMTTPAYTEAQAWDYNLPAKVTNNNFDFWIGAVVPDGSNNGAPPAPQVNGMEIIPDASVAHISIDTGLEAQSPGTLTNITPPLSVPAGSTAQLYAVGWYMSPAVTWSATGGGSINSVSGVYTAPATKPGSPLTVTVTATSTVDGSKTATATIVIPNT